MIDLQTEIQTQTRKAVEFLLEVTNYTEENLRRKDVVEFFQILTEQRDRLDERVKTMEREAAERKRKR